MYFKDDRKFQVRKFLRENGPSRFRDIKKHLENIGLGYSGNKGLIKLLNNLEKEHLIKKDRKAKYPLYSVVEDLALDFAIAGEQYTENAMEPTMSFVANLDENYYKRDLDLLPYDDYDSKFLKIMITLYGFYVFSALLKNIDYWIKKGDNSNENDNYRKIWFEQAFDFVKNQEMIVNSFFSKLMKGKVSFDDIEKRKPFVKRRIREVKKLMRELYPKLSQAIPIYEVYFEKQYDTISVLKKNQNYKKEIIDNFKF